MALTLAEKTQLCALAADSKKAEEIVVLDVEQLSSVADYFLICSGTSDRQVRAIADAIAEELAQHGEKPLAMEGYQKGTWTGYRPVKQALQYDCASACATRIIPSWLR